MARGLRLGQTFAFACCQLQADAQRRPTEGPFLRRPVRRSATWNLESGMGRLVTRAHGLGFLALTSLCLLDRHHHRFIGVLDPGFAG